MTRFRGSVSDEDLDALIQEIHEFQAQEIYSGVAAHIASYRPVVRVAFWVLRRFASSRLVNAVALSVVFLVSPSLREGRSGAEVYEFGLSANNLRAFNRLNRAVQAAQALNISINGSPAPLLARLRLALCPDNLARGATALVRRSHEDPLVQLQAIIGCAVLMSFRALPIPATVKVVCVANDHLPATLALLAHARKEQLKTCYVQHAPVTEHFPPLKFDLSVLSDRMSARVYENAAAARGQRVPSSVVVLSPFETPFSRPGPVTAPVRLGVCLSLWPDWSRLIDLLEEISRHPHVGAILVRPHPRCRASYGRLLRIKKLAIQARGATAASFFESVDVVLAPNSGVTIEALHSGKPTFFVPNVDKVELDYYGFVKHGVVPVFGTKLLDAPHALHRFFDEAWVDLYSAYDETAFSSSRDSKRRVASAFCALIAGGAPDRA